jgi:DNA-binding winged helix-turn-helix (wHTH) protein
MDIWSAYPADYRLQEVQSILKAVRAGECVSIVGLSGAGKSNLLGFIAHYPGLSNSAPTFILADLNRLPDSEPAAVFRLLSQLIKADQTAGDEYSALEASLERRLRYDSIICILLDRFDALHRLSAQSSATHIAAVHSVYANLRSLRDSFKYRLTFVTATRSPLDSSTELAELFFANTLWLGPLDSSDARWSVAQFAKRKGLGWSPVEIDRLVEISWGYPSLLRAVCEAHAAGTPLQIEALSHSEVVRERVAEFWEDHPDHEALSRSRLEGQPLLLQGKLEETIGAGIDTADLSAKEYLLLEYFQAHANQVCEKDELIHAVWPEDKIFERGIRDDSLAQLVHRLRVKIEKDVSTPHHIQTIPGRGYLFKIG